MSALDETFPSSAIIHLDAVDASMRHPEEDETVVLAAEEPATELVVAENEDRDVELVAERGHGRLRAAWEAGVRAVKGAAVAIELMPWTNEPIRYGSFAYTQTITHNPLVGAAVLGGSTLLVEGAGALGAAEWVANDSIGSALDRFDEKVSDTKLAFLSPKKYMPESVSAATEAGIALTLGTVASMEVKQRENPDRTAEQNRRRGLTTAALLAGYCAVEGALLAEGIGNITEPKIVGPAALAIAALHYGVKKIKNMRRNKAEGAEEGDRSAEVANLDAAAQDEEPVVHGSKKFDATPRYDLSQEELSALESSLVDSIKERFPEEGVYAALIDPTHEYANVARAYEAGFFPEVKELTAEVEQDTLFLTLIDTRTGSDRVVHAATITGFKRELPQDGVEAEQSGESTGFVVTDDLVSMGNFTAQEFRDYYAAKGIDLKSCISVETNFRVGERVPKYNGIDTVDLAYLTIFNVFLQNQPNPKLGESAVFASVNRASLVSFGRVGIEHELLMGRDDFHTSEEQRGLKYTPVVIPYTTDSAQLFGGLASMRLPEATFSREEQK